MVALVNNPDILAAKERARAADIDIAEASRPPYSARLSAARTPISWAPIPSLSRRRAGAD